MRHGPTRADAHTDCLDGDRGAPGGVVVVVVLQTTKQDTGTDPAGDETSRLGECETGYSCNVGGWERGCGATGPFGEGKVGLAETRCETATEGIVYIVFGRRHLFLLKGKSEWLGREETGGVAENALVVSTHNVHEPSIELGDAILNDTFVAFAKPGLLRWEGNRYC